ncbi:hypothetical protein HELRODRAFT_175506 [Helobdella robusta]|uniref:Uncharacterized protein n=1 Tax=Helobdella robusta TaxID=6412 RepID=T1F9C2_HELRO|nr:hypothetical protein HELRODRAFT_175506 [Helobdella robusta]ESO00546.1 hypothetical protein HELRODRAFT_175506 [Helobdella robusta]
MNLERMRRGDESGCFFSPPARMRNGDYEAYKSGLKDRWFVSPLALLRVPQTAAEGGDAANPASTTSVSDDEDVTKLKNYSTFNSFNFSTSSRLNITVDTSDMSSMNVTSSTRILEDENLDRPSKAAIFSLRAHNRLNEKSKYAGYFLPPLDNIDEGETNEYDHDAGELPWDESIVKLAANLKKDEMVVEENEIAVGAFCGSVEDKDTTPTNKPTEQNGNKAVSTSRHPGRNKRLIVIFFNVGNVGLLM